MENERSGLEVGFEFRFGKGHGLVVVVGADDVDMNGLHLDLPSVRITAPVASMASAIGCLLTDPAAN